LFSIPDPGSASNNLSILTQGFQALGNMIRVVHPGSGTRRAKMTHKTRKKFGNFIFI
jgi:hypothetical protein